MIGPALSPQVIMVVFGTRPEAIKMFPVIRALRAKPGLDVRICLTGQHRDMVGQVLGLAGLEADVDLNVMQPNQSLDALLARLVIALGQVFDRDLPARVLVHGDTLTTMAATLAAYFRKIPVGHVEAGLRTGDIYQPWPEEVNRKVTATIADLHFAPTEAAAEALRREHVNQASIHVTGNTVIDALLQTRDTLAQRPELGGGINALHTRFSGQKIIAVTAHRRENFGAGMAGIATAIATLACQRPDFAFIYPLHPNPNVRPVMEAALSGLTNVALTEPLDYPQFVQLLDLSTLVLTDSGGVQEEAPALGKPVLVLRETTERPEGISAGTARLVGTDPARIISQILGLLDDDRAYATMSRAHNPYGDGKAAERIAEIIAHAG